MEVKDNRLYNKDLAPLTEDKRNWSFWTIAALWVAMVVCIPTYLLASSLYMGGMSWKMALSSILLGNLIVLIPMILNAIPGTKYGIPFPVLLRSSFGIKGSNLAGFLRIIIACGWFSIQTWIGGNAVYIILVKLTGASLSSISGVEFLDINLLQFLCFILFWILNIIIIIAGVNCFKWFEDLAAPLLIIMSIALFIWAYKKAGGFSDIFSKTSDFKSNKDYWLAFVGGVTANVGFWATLSLNISDFSRYAKRQKDQILGQFLGLPFTMIFFCLISIFVTGVTMNLYGKIISDPVELVGQMDSILIIFISLFFLIIATLSTNIAANIIPAAFYFSNLLPNKISFKTGGIITGLIGLCMFPWLLINHLVGWLISYSALVGPIAGIMISDYFLVKKQKINVEALFDSNGIYKYKKGYNLVAFLAFIIGVLPNLPGFLMSVGIINKVEGSIWLSFFSFAWFIGFFVSLISYYILMKIVYKKND